MKSSIKLDSVLPISYGPGMEPQTAKLDEDTMYVSDDIVTPQLDAGNSDSHVVKQSRKHLDNMDRLTDANKTAGTVDNKKLNEMMDLSVYGDNEKGVKLNNTKQQTSMKYNPPKNDLTKVSIVRSCSAPITKNPMYYRMITVIIAIVLAVVAIVLLMRYARNKQSKQLTEQLEAKDATQQTAQTINAMLDKNMQPTMTTQMNAPVIAQPLPQMQPPLSMNTQINNTTLTPEQIQEQAKMYENLQPTMNTPIPAPLQPIHAFNTQSILQQQTPIVNSNMQAQKMQTLVDNNNMQTNMQAPIVNSNMQQMQTNMQAQQQPLIYPLQPQAPIQIQQPPQQLPQMLPQMSNNEYRTVAITGGRKLRKRDSKGRFVKE